MVSKYDTDTVLARDPLVRAPLEETEEALRVLDDAIVYRRHQVDGLRAQIWALETQRDELSAALAGPS